MKSIEGGESEDHKLPPLDISSSDVLNTYQQWKQESPDSNAPSYNFPGTTPQPALPEVFSFNDVEMKMPDGGSAKSQNDAPTDDEWEKIDMNEMETDLFTSVGFPIMKEDKDTTQMHHSLKLPDRVGGKYAAMLNTQSHAARRQRSSANLETKAAASITTRATTKPTATEASPTVAQKTKRVPGTSTSNESSQPRSPARDTWTEKFELLRAYKVEHGNCDVPQKKTLGTWVNKVSAYTYACSDMMSDLSNSNESLPHQATDGEEKA